MFPGSICRFFQGVQLYYAHYKFYSRNENARVESTILTWHASIRDLEEFLISARIAKERRVDRY